MHSLLYCLASNLGIFVLFKHIPASKESIRRIILLNYFTAFIWGIILTPDLKSTIKTLTSDFYITAGLVALGILFIFLFKLIAQVTQNQGVSVAAAASKLSFVPSVTFLVWWFGQNLSVVQWAAWLIAGVAVYLLFIAGKPDRTQWKGPLILMSGSAVIEVLINLIQNQIHESLYAGMSASIFGIAGLLGCIMGWITKMPQVKEWLFGAAIGTINFFSIYFLIAAMQWEAFDAGFVLVLLNAGILTGGTLIGTLSYKEKMNWMGWMGVFLAVLGILLSMA